MESPTTSVVGFFLSNDPLTLHLVMHRLSLLFIILSIIYSTNAMAEVYGRPYYPYPAPIPGYPLPYLVPQPSHLSEPTFPQQQPSLPKAASATTAPNIQIEKPTSTESNYQVSEEASSSKIAEAEHTADNNPRTETLTKDSHEPTLTKGALPTNLSQPDSIKNVDGKSTIDPLVSSDKGESAPEQTIIDVSVSEQPVEKTINGLHVEVPKEIPIAEQLLLAQPKIEKAIKSGNFAEAYYLWRPLAEGGDPSAQYGIGWMYHNGYGLAIDDQKAYEWWSRAAAQNYVEAIFSIGTLYQFGYGPLQKNMRIALGYYLMAAVAGHEESRLILQTMLNRKERSIKPILPALLRYHLYSAIAGESDSQAVLRQMFQTKDSRILSILPKLLNFYLESAIAGELNSQQILKQMLIRMIRESQPFCPDS